MTTKAHIVGISEDYNEEAITILGAFSTDKKAHAFYKKIEPKYPTYDINSDEYEDPKDLFVTSKEVK